MNRLLELAEISLDAELTSLEEQEFEQLLEQCSREEQDEVMETFLIEGCLRGKLSTIDVAARVTGVLQKRRSVKTSKKIMNAVRQRHSRKTSRPKKTSLLLPMTLAAVLFLTFGTFWYFSSVQDNDIIASISVQEGGTVVLMTGGSQEEITQLPIQLKNNSTVKTPFGAIITLPNGSRLRTGRGSSLSVHKTDSLYRTKVISGHVNFSIKLQAKESFRVETQEFKVAVTGTEFDVSVEESRSHVMVREGQVKVSSFGKDYDLKAGGLLQVDSGKVHFKRAVFDQDFENGELSSALSEVRLVENEKLPSGNSSDFAVKGIVVDPNPEEKAQGPHFKNLSKGLFRYHPKQVIRFRYRINEHCHWLGVWMRSDKANINVYTSIADLEVGKWALAEVPLKDLKSKIEGQKLKAGDLISRLQIQTSNKAKAEMYIDDIIIAE